LQKRFQPLFFAWSFGSLAIMTALLLSYAYDLPTGYTIIFIVVGASVLSALCQMVSVKKEG
jgi:zinc/manganese transport system permease protein